jgi:HK97 gp10 family phage protein
MPGDISLTGASELVARIEALPDKVANNVMSGALYAGARRIRDEARRRAPILDLAKWHGPREPGVLRQNIVARRSRSRSQHEIFAKVGITRDAFYGHFIEYGTRHAAAYPFMRPAVDTSQGSAAQAVVDYARERLDAEASTP